MKIDGSGPGETMPPQKPLGPLCKETLTFPKGPRKILLCWHPVRRIIGHMVKSIKVLVSRCTGVA
jgi:hypothetical protein